MKRFLDAVVASSLHLMLSASRKSHNMRHVRRFVMIMEFRISRPDWQPFLAACLFPLYNHLVLRFWVIHWSWEFLT